VKMAKGSHVTVAIRIRPKVIVACVLLIVMFTPLCAIIDELSFTCERSHYVLLESIGLLRDE